jgi:t-SNARE complex subunit (syntaxin)
MNGVATAPAGATTKIVGSIRARAKNKFFTLLIMFIFIF